MTSTRPPILLLLLMTMLSGCASTQPYQSAKAITSLAFSPDQKLLAFANANEIRVIETDSKRLVGTIRALPPEVDGADPRLFRHGVGDTMVFLDETRIASTGMGGLVSVWNVKSGDRVAVIPSLSNEEFASTIDYSQASNRLLIGTSAGRVLASTLSNGRAEEPAAVTVLESYIWDLQSSRDGRYFAVASQMLSKTRNQISHDEPADEFARSMGSGDTAPPVGEQAEEPADEFARINNRTQTVSSNVVIWDMQRGEQVGSLNNARGVLTMDLGSHP